jgi:hypothetical protein
MDSEAKIVKDRLASAYALPYTIESAVCETDANTMLRGRMIAVAILRTLLCISKISFLFPEPFIHENVGNKADERGIQSIDRGATLETAI